MKRKNTKGFTLVELLIVIALIAILSVAVLATINPIEQANKAKDSSVQNDAAEVMNAYERYYANKQSYPWMAYGVGGTQLSVESATMLRSTSVGFGICDAGDLDSIPTANSSDCDTESTDPGQLIVQDELKPSFVGKAAFSDTGNKNENILITYKAQGSGGSIYVCYVPKAKSNRDSVTNDLWCLDEANVTRVGVGATGVGACTPPTTDSDAWAEIDTALSGSGANRGIWKCVP